MPERIAEVDTAGAASEVLLGNGLGTSCEWAWRRMRLWRGMGTAGNWVAAPRYGPGGGCGLGPPFFAVVAWFPGGPGVVWITGFAADRLVRVGVCGPVVDGAGGAGR